MRTIFRLLTQPVVAQRAGRPMLSREDTELWETLAATVAGTDDDTHSSWPCFSCAPLRLATATSTAAETNLS
jgi:hypothetical protein